MSAQEVLLRAADRVERGWTQGAQARDEYDCGVPSTHPSAVCWCAIGAICVEARPDWRGYDRAMLALSAVLGVGGVARWNDEPGRTAAEVAAAMRKAAQA